MIRLINGGNVSLKLPTGYRLDFSDPDILALRRSDGEAVARFVTCGFAFEAVERVAAEDYQGGKRSG